LPDSKPRVALFGGTGGLGKGVAPLLDQDFSTHQVGRSTLNIGDEKAVQAFFEEEGYFPIIIYLAVCNHDAVLHKVEVNQIIPQLEVNINGFLNVLRYGLPPMRKSKYGRIIYISSILSERPIPGTGVYSATKAFNDNLVRTCALENAKYNITCNSLQLGYFNAGLSSKVPQNVLIKVMDRIPAGRLGNERDLEKVIRFIIESSYMTGVNLPLSGGLDIN
jgi:NAD(P)-dependent dehydrogenase (short-subunit alcohol dehydrogenase family)